MLRSERAGISSGAGKSCTLSGMETCEKWLI